MNELDQALIRFAQGSLEYGGGLSNHGPMVAEALQALGHPSLIPAWVDVYAARLRARERGEPIPPSDWESALGSGRDGDWIETLLLELERTSTGEVLAAWLPRLVPGLFAGAAHGLLRTAHAVRALGELDSAPRREALGIGLAYWASRYQALPGQPGRRRAPGTGPAALLESLPLLSPSARRPGFLTNAVRALDGHEDFVRAIEGFDPDALGFDEAVSELCATAAGLYLAHPEARIAYAHCVTAPSALRLLEPHLDASARTLALGHAAAAVAALYATNGRADASPAAAQADPELLALAESPAELRYRAACSLEEHAVKLTEACLREDAIRPDPRLRLAAADAATRIGASRGGRGG